MRLPGRHLRSLAAKLQSFHRTSPSPPPSIRPISVVCISDTHGTQPPIPPGDLLLHAGDLTRWGTFAEIRKQLNWLSALPHKHKVVIAGNHDLLLDSDFELMHPLRWLQWQHIEEATFKDELLKKVLKAAEKGGVIYLQNKSTTLGFGHSDGEPERTITIYGSPLIPERGQSAFQHPKDQDVWTSTIPANTDILLTHGPPWGHLDGIMNPGCIFLAREITRVRPRMVVFGHIHMGYGTEEVVYDTVGRAFEGINGGWGGWGSLLKMAVAVIWGHLFPQGWRNRVHKTTFVNAAIVEGRKYYRVKNEAVVITI